MAKFSETLIRYSPLIGQILGNIDDIRVTRNYNEARKDIENAEKKRQEYQKFLTYNQKLRSIDPSDKDFYNTKEVLDPNITGNDDDFYQNTLIGQDYLNRKNLYTETDETGKKYRTDENNNKLYLDQDPLYTQDINKILETNPEYAEDLRQKGFYKTLYEPKDEKERKSLLYTKVGIPEEEAKWYEQYSQTFNPQDYNLQLQRMVLDKYPDLISSGEYGSKYFDLFGKQMSTMGINAPEYKFSANKDYLLKYDDTGNYEIIPIKNPNAGDEQKKQFRELVNDKKNWYAKQDYKGDWHYYANYYDVDGGTFKEMKMRKMSDDEIEEKESKKYEKGLDIQKKELQIQKLLGILPGYNSGKSGKSGNRGGNRSGDSGSSGEYTKQDEMLYEKLNSYNKDSDIFDKNQATWGEDEKADKWNKLVAKRNELTNYIPEGYLDILKTGYTTNQLSGKDIKKVIIELNHQNNTKEYPFNLGGQTFNLRDQQQRDMAVQKFDEVFKSNPNLNLQNLETMISFMPRDIRNDLENRLLKPYVRR